MYKGFNYLGDSIQREIFVSNYYSGLIFHFLFKAFVQSLTISMTVEYACILFPCDTQVKR